MKVIGFIASVGSAAAFKGSAFEKVTQVVTNLESETDAMIKETQVEYERVTTTKEGEISNLAADISRMTQDMETARSKAEACKADKEAADADRADGENRLDIAEGNLAAAIKVQKIDMADCKADQHKFQTRINRLQNAIKQLKHMMESVTNKQALIQIMKEFQAPQADKYTYESSSGKIVEIAEGMHKTASQDLADRVKECKNNKHAFNMESQDQNAAIKTAKTDIEQASAASAAGQKCHGEQTKNANDLSANIETSSNLKRQTESTLKTYKEDTNKELSELNTQLTALGKVLSTLDAKVKAGSKQMTFLQGASLVQLHSAPMTSGVQARLAAFLSKRSHDLKSTVLATLASKASGPFDSVKNMIETLIAKLQKESLEETSANDVCRADQEANTDELNKLNTKYDDNAATKEETEAKIELLTTEIADHNAQVQELTQMLKEATEERNENKALNTKHIKEGNDATEGLNMILKIVNEEMTGDAQTRLLTLFETMLSSYAQFVTETEQAEESAKVAHQNLSEETEVAISGHEQNITNKNQNNADAKALLAQTDQTIENTSELLKQSRKVRDTIAKRCSNQMTHEEKMAKMADEIQSLKEALSILEDA